MYQWAEEYIAYDYCGDEADEVGEEAADKGVAGVPDIDAAEVDCEDVEGGFGGALYDGCELALEGVYSVTAHHIDHKAAGAAAAEGLHEGYGQIGHKLCAHATHG